MPQVSKRKVKREVSDRMFAIFYQEIADLKTSEEARLFFGDLLTQTEKIMLAKRLAIAIMLVKGYSYPLIKDVLKVSSTTISGVKTWLDHAGAGYCKVIEKLLKRERVERLMPQDLGEVLSGPFPTKGASWKKFHQKQNIYQQQRDLKTLL